MLQATKTCICHISYATVIPGFIGLCFVALCGYCAFYTLKVCGGPASSKPISTVFPAAFAHFLSLCHILVILAIFQTFFITIIFVMMICDQ